VNGYQCLCPTVFSGTNCARLQEQCTGIECLNGGRCISNGTQFVCLCPSGYQGDNCELIIDYCQSQPVRKKTFHFVLHIENDLFSVSEWWCMLEY